MVLKKKEEFVSKRVCPYALIIEPTRELAIQLYEQARKLADCNFYDMFSKLNSEFGLVYETKNSPVTGMNASPLKLDKIKGENKIFSGYVPDLKHSLSFQYFFL